MLLKKLWNCLAKLKAIRIRYKYIQIYVDSKQNLIFIPIGLSRKWGPISIDSVSELKAPYSDDQLEQELTNSLNRCYSKTADDDLKVSALERYLGVKGFAKACQRRKLVEYRWTAKDGYSITPTNKAKGEGYLHMDDQSISIGKSFNKGDLAKAVKQAIKVSKTYESSRGDSILTPFGYKMGWMAIRNTDKKEIITTLGLTEIKELSWDEGIDTSYSEGNDNVVFVTPPVNDWTFVIGRWALGTGEEDSVHHIEDLITKLSTQFDEVQAFATHRVIEYHHWMSAQKGHLVRAFAYLGESGEVLTNTGELTPIEQSYSWDQLEECLWSPDEETVLEVAGFWSVNPTDIEALTIEGMGILAQAPAM